MRQFGSTPHIGMNLSAGRSGSLIMDRDPMLSLTGAGSVIPSLISVPIPFGFRRVTSSLFLSRNGTITECKQYQIAISHQGADEITTRLWFDVANKER